MFTRKLLILGAFFCATSVCVHADSAYDQASKSSSDAYTSGRLLEAQEQTRQALALATTPEQKLNQLRRLALIAVKDKQPDEARQWLEQAEPQIEKVLKSSDISDESKANAMIGISQAYRQTADKEKAVNVLQQALKLREVPLGVSQQVRFSLAGALVEDKQFEEARALLQDIVNTPGISKKLYSLSRYGLAGSYVNEKKEAEGLDQLALVVSDKRVDIGTRALSQQLIGNVLTLQGKQLEAQTAFLGAIALYEQLAKTEPDARGAEATAYTGYLKSYETQSGRDAAGIEAMRLYAPLSDKASKFRGAYDYEAALPYYQAMQGFVDYLPFEFHLLTKVGLGEMLMYGKQWDEARKLINVAAGLRMSAGVTGQQRENIAILQQSAQRLMAYSYLLQGQTQGGEIEFAKARELYDALLATPDLNAAIRVMTEKNVKELERFEK